MTEGRRAAAPDQEKGLIVGGEREPWSRTSLRNLPPRSLTSVFRQFGTGKAMMCFPLSSLLHPHTPQAAHLSSQGPLFWSW